MPWDCNDTFYYSTGILRAIAECYKDIYGGLSIGEHYIANLFETAEFKADFDRVLNELGTSKWDGKPTSPNHYRYFDKKQRIIIFYILGIRSDYKLESWGFWEARKYRHKVFKEMVTRLNERRV